MSNLNNIIRSAVLSFSACAVLACAEVEDPHGDAVGYLAFPSLDVDVTVEDLTQTKALDFEVVAPEASAMHFVVRDKDGNVKYDKDGLWTEPLVLPVGSYTVDAYAGENGFGAPYFKGSASGTIDPLDSEVPALSVALANALVNVSVSDALAAHFSKDDKLSLNGGVYEATYGEWFYVPAGADLSLELTGTNSAGKPVTLSHTLKSPSPKAAYRVTCGTETTDWPSISLSLSNEDVWASRIYITAPASFSGNISADNQAAVVYEAIPSASSDWTAPATAVSENGVMVIKGLVPGTEYQVRARVGALVSPVVKATPQIDGLSVTAVHTSTSGELDGTDVTSTFSKSAAVTNAIESWKLHICKADGTVLRSENALGTSDGSAITSTKGWPYLPAGSYKVAVKVVMTDGEEVALEVPFNAVHPVFTLTPMCKTTYNYYLVGDKANANAETGSKTAAAKSPSTSLYEIGSSVSISSNLMSNTNYAKSVYYAAMKDSEVVISTDGNVDFGTSKSHTVGDVHDIFTDWRAYVLSVKMNFAGTEITASRNFHITGLPYTKDFTSDSATDGWSFVERSEYNKDYSQDYRSGCGYLLYYAYTNDYGCHSFSPTFYSPTSINIGYSANFYAGVTGSSAKTHTIYGGVTSGTTVVQSSNTSITEKQYCLTSGYNSVTLSGSSQIANGNRLSFSHNADLAWGQAAEHFLYIGYLNVKYR